MRRRNRLVAVDCDDCGGCCDDDDEMETVEPAAHPGDYRWTPPRRGMIGDDHRGRRRWLMRQTRRVM